MVVKDKLYQKYYTDSTTIVDYMQFLLKVLPGDKVLEPSVGEGHLLKNLTIDTKIVVVDMDKEAIEHISKSYPEYECIVYNFIDIPDLFIGKFDKIISNPPYGAYIDIDKRKNLKTYYPEISTKESYALFVYKSINLLEKFGRAVFILPDTFLFLGRHRGLRSFIVNNSIIESITKFPSKLFPGVNFGYSGMCILSVVKDIKKDYSYKIYGVRCEADFANLLVSNTENIEVNERRLSDVKDSIDVRMDFDNLGKDIKPFSDYAHIVTGIYSGNDKEFVRCKSKDQKRAKNYEIVDTADIFYKDPSLDGVDRISNAWIPIIKGGASNYVKSTKWYINWNKKSVLHYKNDKKARFQNSQFYFRDGIGIPMVTSGKITGAFLQKRLFDQSIVGIFPHNDEFLHYFLAFTNTQVFTDLVRNINPSANNSANYIKKVPIILPSPRVIRLIEKITINILENIEDDVLVKFENQKIEDIFLSIYKNIIL